MLYLCISYPENNLFTLKKRLIPIEDLKRSPVKVIAFFVPLHLQSLSDYTLNIKQYINEY